MDSKTESGQALNESGPEARLNRPGCILFPLVLPDRLQKTQRVDQQLPVLFRQVSQKVQEAAHRILPVYDLGQAVGNGRKVGTPQEIISGYPVKVSYLHQGFQIGAVYAVFIVGDTAGTSVKQLRQCTLFVTVPGSEFPETFRK